MGDEVLLVLGEGLPVPEIRGEVDLLGGPERSFRLLVHAPHLVLLDGEEAEAILVILKHGLVPIAVPRAGGARAGAGPVRGPLVVIEGRSEFLILQKNRLARARRERLGGQRLGGVSGRRRGDGRDGSTSTKDERVIIEVTK